MILRSTLGVLVSIGAVVCGAAAGADGSAPTPAPVWLGVSVVDAVDGGLRTVSVASAGPADRAGLREGDILVRAGAADLATTDDLTRVLGALRPGEQLTLALWRGAARLSIVVTLKERAPDRGGGERAPGVQLVRLVDATPELRLHLGAPADTGVLVVEIEGQRDVEPEDRRLLVGDVLLRVGDRSVHNAAEIAGSSWQPDRAAVVRRGRVRDLSFAAAAADATAVVFAPASPMPVAAPVPASVSARERLGRTLEQEIQRLEQRIEQLRGEIERLQRSR